MSSLITLTASPCSVVPELLTNFTPPAKPVLLHGDLWSGNIATDSSTGEPILFDMSSYYGHNEADFGISQMFSSLTSAFYEKYHSILPKSEPNHSERMKLYELYHHLNHYLMFGVCFCYLKESSTGLMLLFPKGRIWVWSAINNERSSCLESGRA